jgi:dipeptidase E
LLHPKTCIVACGGSPLHGRNGVAMHRQIRALCKKKRPNALLIPTATYDHPETVANFNQTYSAKLGCRTDALLLLNDPPSHKAVKTAIESADIVVVSGGNTLKMMRRWRKLGVDRLLIAAQRRGTVLAGSSAGAICWFDHGHSDSMAYYHPEDWNYIRVRCLGIIPATGCPHVLAEGRLRHFEHMIAKRGGIGIGIDNDCAIAWIGGRYRVFRARPNAKAFRVTKRRGGVDTVEIRSAVKGSPVESLLT